jgi:hypothetical protein
LRRGVSRLEIVLSLIVICVLMSLMLHRLAALGAPTRAVRLQTTAAAVQAAAALFHVRCQASGGDCAELTLDGRTVRGVNAWPAASREGIARAAAIASDFTLLPQGRALRIALPGGHCEFLYAEATSPGDSPVVDIVDATCH